MSLVGNLLRDFRKGDAERRKTRRFHRQIAEFDPEAQETILQVKDYTMLNPEKLYAFINAIRYVSKQEIGGDIVECGVWRGGAIMAAALTLRQLGSAERRFFLYDTFAGMPRPTERDRALVKEVEPLPYFNSRQTGGDSSDWCCASLEDVRSNLAKVPYDQDKFHLVEGKVEDTIPDHLPGSIAILRLDTDWYESTRHEMEHLMPKLVSGGVLIVDDYYCWAGNQEAVDEYLDRHRVPVLLTKVGRSAIGVVP